VEHHTTKAAAQALGQSGETLRRWARAGLVTPAYTSAGGWMYWDLDQLREEVARINAKAPTPAEGQELEVVAAIITSPRGVLVTRRMDGNPPWGFLTGEIEPGESPADAAIREAKEEAGLRIRHGRVIGKRVHPATKRIMVYVAARPVGSTDAYVADTDELAEVRWCSLVEAEQLLPGMYEPVRAYLARALSELIS
jgi:8-oxo-dGTP pyrophosphatase MutT (NUDIX family)